MPHETETMLDGSYELLSVDGCDCSNVGAGLISVGTEGAD
jgi:hypothetical protein